MTISATTGTRPTHRREDDDAPAPPSRRAASPTPSRIIARQIDAGIVAAARNAPAPSVPRGDGILYLGMNEASAATEAAALRAVSSKVVAVINDSATKVGQHDLATDEGCAAFAHELAAKNGMSDGAAAQIAKTLVTTNVGARRELALVATALAPGERGVSVPSRIVLSGHSYSFDVHGKDASAQVSFAAIRALATAMPEAAKQIEDVHISGCNTGNQIEDHEAWQDAFPNLKTMWGYGGMAPGAPTGHLQTWAGATQGRSTADPARGRSLGVVETWSSAKGIHTSISLDELRGRRDVADAAYDGLVRGQGTPGPTGAAKNPYETFREMAGRSSATAEERQDAGAKAEVLLRVRFHASVGKALTEAHGPEIHDAYASLGLAVPDFATLSRRGALDALATFDAKLAATHPAPYAAIATTPLLHGLRDLDPAIIPSSWCH